MRLTGYVRDAKRRPIPSFMPEVRRGNVPALLATLPANVSLRMFAPPIFDQGGTGSCTAHARVRGVVTARAAAGKPLTFIPSMAELYKLTRCFERNNWHTPLEDVGADPVHTIDAMSGWGVKPMGNLAEGRFSDADPQTINELPTLLALEEEAEWRFLDDHMIEETGDERLGAVCTALTAGYPVCVDVAGSTEQFQSYAGGTLTADAGALDHYVTITGYAMTQKGIMFDLDNSWGTSWGIKGRAQCDATVIQKAQDLIVCVEHSK